MTARLPLLTLAAGIAGLSACAVGPDYQRPAAPTPTAFKEASGWKPAQPGIADDSGAWWSAYRDPVLDELERRVSVSNQNLLAAEAAYRQASAAARAAEAGFLPTAGLNAGAQRAGRGPGSAGPDSSRIQNQFSVSGNISWSVDLWGRIRRLVEGDVAQAQASAADLAAARLSAQATLAIDYFELRAADENRRLLHETSDADARSLEIARNEYAVGVVAKIDVLQAQTQLAGVQSQEIAVESQRAQLEHAIAVLTGRPPSELTIAAVEGIADPPQTPLVAPSALLERRPDIASAERRMAAANAQIGFVEAAYYPDLTLTASGGYSNPALDSLFDAPSRLWALGSQLTETVFDGGLRRAQVQGAEAAYDQQVANYRATVLDAFAQVEDALSTGRVLGDQAQAQAVAVENAAETQRVTLNQYRAGTVSYVNVLAAQSTLLTFRETALSIRESRLVASVQLIEALGGHWEPAQLPQRGDILSGAKE
jgi:NodT family efflux transporter outer membrane factor (OMF) lipoprotein